MTLAEILKTAGHEVGDITRIYRGRDNYCRCGCGGVYHEPGSRGMKMAVNRMSKNTFNPDGAIEIGKTYVNIPYDSNKDLCYCVYFD